MAVGTAKFDTHASRIESKLCDGFNAKDCFGKGNNMKYRRFLRREVRNSAEDSGGGDDGELCPTLCSFRSRLPTLANPPSMVKHAWQIFFSFSELLRPTEVSGWEFAIGCTSDISSRLQNSRNQKSWGTGRSNWCRKLLKSNKNKLILGDYAFGWMFHFNVPAPINVPHSGISK